MDSKIKKDVLALLANANNITLSEYIKKTPASKKTDVLTLCKALNIKPLNIDDVIKIK